MKSWKAKPWIVWTTTGVRVIHAARDTLGVHFGNVGGAEEVDDAGDFGIFVGVGTEFPIHLGDTGAGDPVSEGQSADDDEDDARCELHGLRQRSNDLAGAHAPIDQQPLNDRNECCYAGRFRDRHDATVDPAEHDHGNG